MAPDASPKSKERLFYRPEVILTFQNLPLLRPSVFYLFGGQSTYNGSVASRVEKIGRTGTGVGGSGGAAAGKVSSVFFEEVGHLLPLECVKRCAGELAGWVDGQIRVFEEDQQFLRTFECGRSTEGGKVLGRLWEENVRLHSHAERVRTSKL